MSNNPLITKFEKLVKDLNTIIFGDDDQDVILDGVVKPTISKWLRSIVTDLNDVIDIAAAAGAGANGWTAQLVVDGSENQHQINRSTVRTVETIAALLSIQNPYAGQTVQVLDDLRGGKFEYFPSRSTENNGGTVFNGWVRKYFGSVHLDWFCDADPKTADCSIYMERALAVTKGVKCSGREFLFTGRVGIPDVIDPLVGNEQSIYAKRKITITGDGDTVFLINCSLHNRPTFTSARAKANPTSTQDIYVGKVFFTDINFYGVNTTGGFDLNEANKNTVDSVFDGDRLYNSGAKGCNFLHLRSALRCMQNRGAAVEGGNAYSQSFSFINNDFHHNLLIAEANSLLNFRFLMNRCEKNYGGFKVNSLSSTSAALGVASFDYNVFEGGGQFMNITGDVFGSSIWNNYFEYNIFEDVLTNLCQIGITGQVLGGVIGANNFGGQINFPKYDTEYMDININGKAYEEWTQGSDVTKSKPVLIGNNSTSRQLISKSRAIGIGNSSPYTLKNGWIKEVFGENYFNSELLHSHQENDVSFMRGTFNKPFNYIANDKNGVPKSVLNANSEVMIAIVDLRKLEGGKAKSKLSTITGELDCNIDLIRDGLTVGNISAKIHISVFNTGFGSADSAQYDSLRVRARLISIIQPYDIPIVSTHPNNLMKKQFVEPDVKAVVEPLGDGRYAIRLTNFLGTSVGTFGAPLEVFNTFTCKWNVGTRFLQEQIANSITFRGFWW